VGPNNRAQVLKLCMAGLGATTLVFGLSGARGPAGAACGRSRTTLFLAL
jgi:hypothetical protein